MKVTLSGKEFLKVKIWNSCLPVPVLEDLRHDDRYIVKVDTDKNVVEVGYPEDEEWSL